MVTIIKSIFFKKSRLFRLTTVRISRKRYNSPIILTATLLTGFETLRFLCQRSFVRKTNLSPDHTSSTAQTFTSTKPADKPKSRIIFSSKSVGTLEDFLGQETHNIPVFLKCLLLLKNALVNACRSWTNKWMKSNSPDSWSFTTRLVGNGLIQSK